MKDLPLIAQANTQLGWQVESPFAPILKHLMDTAQDIHAFAAPYLAYWAWLGKKPTVDSPNPFKRAGEALAEQIVERITRCEVVADWGTISARFKPLLKVQGRITTSAYGSSDGSSTFAVSQPSNRALRQAAEKSAKDGPGFRGERFIKPKRRNEVVRSSSRGAKTISSGRI